MNKMFKLMASAGMLMATAVGAHAADATNYAGYLNISMMNEQVAINQKSTVQITATSEGKCDFLLPNLTLEGLGSLGDIALQDVTVAEADGVTTYTKAETQMGLLDGAINATVSLDGKIDANGQVAMVIPVVWDASDMGLGEVSIDVTFSTKPAGTEYSGFLNISMMNEQVAVNSRTSVYIVDVADGQCMFLLPDLTLEGLGSLGDISLDGVTVATDGDATTYTKAATQMGLLDGAINATVSLDGKIDANGQAAMVIPVVWDASDMGLGEVSIDVTFSTKPAGTEYNGFLSVAFEESAPMVENMGTAVYITETAEGLCNFLLPDLSLGEGLNLGDIALSGVKVTEADGVKTYTHDGTDMVIDLMGTPINAKVTLNGTIDANGNVDMTIPVVWVEANLPINVKFTTKPAGTPYNGFLSIAFEESAPMVENMGSTVYISEDGYGSCNFMLPNLSLGDGLDLGNIALSGVKVTEADGVKTYTHDGTDMVIDLMGTPINAKVTLNGTIDADGNVDMLIPVVWVEANLPINVKFTTKPAGTEYKGALTVAFEESDPMVENMPASVFISEDGYGSCNFMLPNLSLGEGLDLGNIALSGVKVTEADGVKTYTHDGTDMAIDLMGTPINAKVSLNGTIDAEGNVDMLIPVVWVEANLPINVTFKAKGSSGIVAAEANADVVIYGVDGAVKVAGINGTVSIYNTVGAKVAEANVEGEATIDAPKGIAIVATPTRTAKVIVK